MGPRSLSIVFWFLIPAQLLATNWYLEKGATGGNTNGLSWANAWTNCSGIAWGSIQAGDTLWLGGGAAGTTNDYAAALSQYGQDINNGTINNPIWIRFDGTNTAHNGKVRLKEIYIKGQYWKFDGSRDGVTATPWRPRNVFENWFIVTNIGVELYSTDGGSAGFRAAEGLGADIYWLAIVDRTNQCNTEQVGIAGNSGTNEIAYIYMTNWFDYAFKGETTGSTVGQEGFGRVNIHGCLILDGQDNLEQDISSLDFHDNIFISKRKRQRDSDGFQAGNSYFRVWNNLLSGVTTRWFNVFPAGTNTTQTLGEYYIFNNIFFGELDSITNDPGIPSPNQDCHWDQAIGPAFFPSTVTNAILTNWWIVNNTFYDELGGNIFFWSSVTATGPLTRATNALASDFWLLNNVIVAPTNYASPLVRFQHFDDPEFDGSYGFKFDTNKIVFDYNTIFSHSPSAASLKVKYSTNSYTITELPGSWGFGSGNRTNIIWFENDVISTNPAYVFRPLWNNAPLGTNLAGTRIAEVAPWVTNDIMGNPRGATWNMGTYQRDPSLLVWLSFNQWDGGTNIIDDSGNSNTAHTYGLWVTNVPTITDGPAGFGNAAHFTGNGVSGGEFSYRGQWMGIKPVSAALADLTNATISLWASPEYTTPGVEGNYGTLLDAYYKSWQPGSANGWHLGRHSSYYTRLIMQGNADSDADTNVFQMLVWPDSSESGVLVTNWHHYAFTFDGTNIAGYYDGTNFATTNVTGIVAKLHVYSPDNWIAIGCWHHEGTAAQDLPEDMPNTGWWEGGMDDIRIYNRALSATEISSLFAGGGTSSSSPAAPEPPPAATNQTAHISGYLKLDGQFQLK